MRTLATLLIFFLLTSLSTLKASEDTPGKRETFYSNRLSDATVLNGSYFTVDHRNQEENLTVSIDGNTHNIKIELDSPSEKTIYSYDSLDCTFKRAPESEWVAFHIGANIYSHIEKYKNKITYNKSWIGRFTKKGPYSENVNLDDILDQGEVIEHIDTTSYSVTTVSYWFFGLLGHRRTIQCLPNSPLFKALQEAENPGDVDN